MVSPTIEEIKELLEHFKYGYLDIDIEYDVKANEIIIFALNYLLTSLAGSDVKE